MHCPDVLEVRDAPHALREAPCIARALWWCAAGPMHCAQAAEVRVSYPQLSACGAPAANRVRCMRCERPKVRCQLAHPRCVRMASSMHHALHMHGSPPHSCSFMHCCSMDL
jgi:hypothetical protein